MPAGPGSVLAGYRLETLVARGGMGEVWRATDTRLDRIVALKLLPGELASDPRFRDRFLAESRAAASLDHPNIVPVFEAGDAEGELFIAMRFVDGRDLETIINEEGPLEPRRALALLRGIADALDAAHERGLIHRDVKPGNILVARGARGEHAYLSDFGLTKRRGSAGTVTRSGQVIGSIGYVAPEIIEGLEIDGRADTYSLACVLCACLTGRQPYERDSDMAVLWAHVHAELPAIAAARPELAPLQPVVAQGMAKVPGERFASAGELIDAADRAMAAASQAGAARAYLFSDLRGYTEYVERAGDTAAVALLGRYRALARAAIARHQGAEIRTEGDSFYVVFPAASMAMRAGLDIVAAAAQASTEDPGAPIQVGVGIHAGETSATAEGPVGSAVNVAARICSQARAGEVLVSDTVRSLTRTSLTVTFTDRGAPKLKGVEDRVRLFSVTSTYRSAPVPPGRPASRQPWLLGGLAGAGAIALAILVVAALPAMLGSGASGPAGPSGAPSASAPAVAAATPSAGSSASTVELATTALLGLLPPTIAESCAPATRSDGGLGGTAGLRCELTSQDADTVWFDRFESRGLATEQFERLAAAAGAPGGTCSETGRAALGDWRFGSAYGGRMLCYQADGRSWLVWTYEDKAIVAQAVRSDEDAPSLFRWWKSVGPYLR